MLVLQPALPDVVRVQHPTPQLFPPLRYSNHPGYSDSYLLQKGDLDMWLLAQISCCFYGYYAIHLAGQAVCER